MFKAFTDVIPDWNKGKINSEVLMLFTDIPNEKGHKLPTVHTMIKWRVPKLSVLDATNLKSHYHLQEPHCYILKTDNEFFIKHDEFHYLSLPNNMSIPLDQIERAFRKIAEETMYLIIYKTAEMPGLILGDRGVGFIDISSWNWKELQATAINLLDLKLIEWNEMDENIVPVARETYDDIFG